MLDEIKYENLNSEDLKNSYGKGTDLGLGAVTTFVVVAIVIIVLYKLYGAKTGDITLPGGFKFKFTS